MGKCESCRFAEWDFYEYYNTTEKCWFVCGCKKDVNEEECEEEYEEVEE